MSEATTARSTRCYVIATALNLRSSPAIGRGNMLVTLHQGQELMVLDQKEREWWRVRAVLGRETAVEGYVKASYVKLESEVQKANEITKITDGVDFPADPRARLDSIEARHAPIPDGPFVRRDPAASRERKLQAIDSLIDSLDVEHSPRYLPTTRSTYCNIYAYDYCHFANVYLPRVWFTQKALLTLSHGEPIGVQYGKTVSELNANALHDWLDEWGDDFNWQRIIDVTELQLRVNDGAVGVICARRRELSRSGHITLVIPESDKLRAQRAGGRVVAPVQSQAGARNKQRFDNTWWVDRASEFSAVGFWVHS